MSKRMIVVSDGTPQALYVGTVDVNDEVNDGGRTPIVDGQGFLHLEDCRYLRTLMIPAQNGGIALKNTVMPIGANLSSAKLRVRPAMYYWPDENDGMEVLLKLIKACTEDEQAHKAAEAGLALPQTRLGKLNT